jgi:hypothetical protein
VFLTRQTAGETEELRQASLMGSGAGWLLVHSTTPLASSDETSSASDLPASAMSQAGRLDLSMWDPLSGHAKRLWDPADALPVGQYTDVRAGSYSVSPDGQNIAYKLYALNATESEELLIVRSLKQGSRPHVVHGATEDERSTTFLWSQESDALAYGVVIRGDGASSFIGPAPGWLMAEGTILSPAGNEVRLATILRAGSDPDLAVDSAPAPLLRFDKSEYRFGPGLQLVAWNSKAQRIAIYDVDYDMERGASLSWGNVLLVFDLSSETQLARNQTCSVPTGSPDGQWIACAYPATTGREGVLRVENWASGEQVDLATIESKALQYARPHWSADSQQFAWTERVRSTSDDKRLHVVRLADQSVETIEWSDALDNLDTLGPFAPDGSRLMLQGRKDPGIDDLASSLAAVSMSTIDLGSGQLFPVRWQLFSEKARVVGWVGSPGVKMSW